MQIIEVEMPIDCEIRCVEFDVEQNAGEYVGTTRIVFDENIVAIRLVPRGAA